MTANSTCAANGPAITMTSVESLPDDVLLAIFQDVYHIPRCDFSNPEYEFGRAPGPGRAHSPSSRYLLTCRRWLIAGTPALYETVILRSVAQAQALEDALASHPIFGVYIRKIRIEGESSPSLEFILSVATGVTDLHMSCRGPSDKAHWPASLLKSVNPKALIVSSNIARIAWEISGETSFPWQAISSWTNLVSALRSLA